MPRNFGSFTTSIYRDDDFRALTLSQQGAYYLLGLQPDITAAGVLTLALGRWAAKASGLTRDSLASELAALQDLGHIAIDEATEELLIVKFAKWDRGWANRLRRPVLMAAVNAIESVHIRDIAVDELRKVALSDAVSAEEKQAREALSDALSTWVRTRTVVTEGDHVLEPQPSNHEREPRPVAAVADDPLSPFCPPHQPDGPTGPCGDCGTRRVARQYRGEKEQRETTAAKLARLEAIAGCDRCNENGFIEGVAGELLGSCSHSRPLSPVVCKPREAATG